MVVPKGKGSTGPEEMGEDEVDQEEEADRGHIQEITKEDLIIYTAEYVNKRDTITYSGAQVSQNSFQGEIMLRDSLKTYARTV